MGLPSEANWLVSFPKQSWSSSEMICWPISQPNSPEYHLVKFLSQPCPLFLQKNHVMHSHLTSRLPSAYENALCHFQNHLYNISICLFSINYNYTHVIQHINCDTPKPGGPLTTRQPAECNIYKTCISCISCPKYKTCISCPKQSNICNIYPIRPLGPINNIHDNYEFNYIPNSSKSSKILLLHNIY